MTNTTKIPKLRFKEFSGEWIKEELSKNVKIIGRIGYRGYTVNDLVKKGKGAITISPGNIKNNTTDFSNCSFLTWDKYEQSPEIKIYNNDIIFVKTGSTIGKVALVKKLPEKATLNPQLVVLKDIKLDNTFLYNLMIGKYFNNEILKIIVGGAVPTLSQNEMGKIKIIYPKNIEQQKIASFLSIIDKKIEHIREKKKALKKYKKGVMQKIFKQEIRFKDENGNEFEGWKEVRLGDYIKQKSLRNKENQVDLVLSVSNKKGFITQSEQFDGYEVASKDLTTYKIVHKGDYAYNPSRINVGSIARLKNYDTGIVSPMYVIFQLSNYLNPIFFDNLYKTHRFIHLIKIGCSGSVRDSLNFQDMANFRIELPLIKEQEKIANFLSYIDDKIEDINLELEEIEKFKKGLLQQMFV